MVQRCGCVVVISDKVDPTGKFLGGFVTLTHENLLRSRNQTSLVPGLTH